MFDCQNLALEIFGFIEERGGMVADMDLATHFDAFDDPNLVFPLYCAINHSFKQGWLERVLANHPEQGGRLRVRLATDAIA